MHRLDTGKQVICINSFHPMYAERVAADEDPLVARVRRAALRFSFLQAVSILDGRVFCGGGVKKLRDAVYGASQTPHVLLANGYLDKRFDNRFKGFSLAHNASDEMRRIWERITSERHAEVSSTVADIDSIVPDSQQHAERARELRLSYSACALVLTTFPLCKTCVPLCHPSRRLEQDRKSWTRQIGRKL